MRNWRTHPESQRAALRGVLDEIGYAGALLARELDDGSLELIDGHLCAETTPDAQVPVLVLDVTEAEALKLLATFDPLGSLAETNQNALDDVLALVETESQAVRQLLDELALRVDDGPEAAVPHEVPPLTLNLFQVVVQCQDEAEQRSVFEQMRLARLEVPALESLTVTYPPAESCRRRCPPLAPHRALPAELFADLTG